jgi:hypothetical protein
VMLVPVNLMSPPELLPVPLSKLKSEPDEIVGVPVASASAATGNASARTTAQVL